MAERVHFVISQSEIKAHSNKRSTPPNRAMWTWTYVVVECMYNVERPSSGGLKGSLRTSRNERRVCVLLVGTYQASE